MVIRDMQKALNRFSQRLKDRLFTPAEQEICEARSNPAVHYSGKFAAKESFLKALRREDRQGISWLDIEVLNTDGGQPYLKFSGAAWKAVQEKDGTALLSLSHSGGYAVAFCLLQKD